MSQFLDEAVSHGFSLFEPFFQGRLMDVNECMKAFLENCGTSKQKLYKFVCASSECWFAFLSWFVLMTHLLFVRRFEILFILLCRPTFCHKLAADLKCHCHDVMASWG